MRLALSTMEAEYMALAYCTTQAIWLQQLLAELSITQTSGTTICVDNEAAITLSKNTTFHGRSKHIHTVRDKKT